MLDYKKFQELENTRLILKDKDFLDGKTLQDWIRKNCLIVSGNKTKTMHWGGIKAPAAILITGDIKNSRTSIFNHLIGVGQITDNKSGKTIGWIVKTDSNIAYFTRKWREATLFE